MNTLFFITLTIGFSVITFIMGEKYADTFFEYYRMQEDKFSTPHFLQKLKKKANTFWYAMITCICCYIVCIYFSVHAAAAEFF